MAVSEKTHILGDKQSYCLAEDVKKYSLRDAGFMEKKTGKFLLQRNLDPNVTAGMKLKVTVDLAARKLKMSTTTANGLKEVNIFKTGNVATQTEQLGYLLNDLEERGILNKA